mmetsp:Transcript_19374/g.28664  ORF Transcript_19374/g.28664 Transcript_19374/m.28664 type:complete len:234 (-) Transcript_19374:3078-3779(-)
MILILQDTTFNFKRCGSRSSSVGLFLGFACLFFSPLSFFLFKSFFLFQSCCSGSLFFFQLFLGFLLSSQHFSHLFCSLSFSCKFSCSFGSHSFSFCFQFCLIKRPAFFFFCFSSGIFSFLVSLPLCSSPFDCSQLFCFFSSYSCCSGPGNFSLFFRPFLCIFLPFLFFFCLSQSLRFSVFLSLFFRNFSIFFCLFLCDFRFFKCSFNGKLLLSLHCFLLFLHLTLKCFDLSLQ